jgi:hypothetical protein
MFIGPNLPAAHAASRVALHERRQLTMIGML